MSQKTMALADHVELLQVNDVDFVPRLTDLNCSVSQCNRGVASASDKLLQIE